jgi:mRNA interferase RelE/StbE
MMTMRAILLSDEGPWQTDLIDASGAAPIESGARSGESRTAPADRCPAAHGAEEAVPQQHRPIGICLPL